jgi:GT2 family glycosyltransferase
MTSTRTERQTTAMPPELVASVVVATYNRAPLLPRLVRALEAQRGVGPFEVVIVDDSSTDDTWSVLEKLAATTTLPLHIAQTAQNSGPATARNIGWRTASAPLIAFTDDDCVPDEHWLGRLVNALGEGDVVQGRTEPDPARAVGRGPFARTMIVQTESGLFETCNIGYRRSVLERLGGFDESYRRPYGEDVDLGWRAKESGAVVLWASGAIVVHDVEHSTHFGDWIAAILDTRRRQWAPLMVKQHPGLRADLPWGYFLKRHHPATLLAMAGIVRLFLPGRHRKATALALVLPWLAFRTVVDPLPARPRNLPALVPMTLVTDAAEVVAVVRGSIRHRTLLL